MTADMAYELKDHKVTALALWPGAVMTEQVDKVAYPMGEEKVTLYVPTYRIWLEWSAQILHILEFECVRIT